MIAVIKGIGNNLASIECALQRLDAQFVLTDDAVKIQQADKVILPGVGTARNAMRGLRNAQLLQTVQQLTVPVLGICVGMQVLFDFSEEDQTHCLGIIEGSILKLDAPRVPHMGWNKVKPTCNNTLLNDAGYGYFVHSFLAPISDDTIASCDYQGEFSAVVQRENFFGVQFHPEKSDVFGEQILKNFVEMRL